MVFNSSTLFKTSVAFLPILTSFISLIPTHAFAHTAPYHPSMYGWDVVAETFPGKGDFRPHVPLMHENFNWWWFHGHIDHPPADGQVLNIPAGGSFMTEIACHKGATSYWRESEGKTDFRTDSSPCPGSPSTQWHANDVNDVTGCGFAIVDKANAHDIQPEDFAMFTVNHKCVWDRETWFQVPENMPSCTNGVCHCAWFFIHSSDSGSQQMYMNAYKCKVTGATEKARKIMKPRVARRCGADPKNGKMEAAPSNCTVGAKQPLYWYQNERNNMFEGTYSPPLYNDLYDFKDGAQNDIFTTEQGYYEGAPPVVATSAVTTSTSSAASATPSSVAVTSSSSTTSLTRTTTSSEGVTTPSATVTISLSSLSSTTSPSSSSLATSPPSTVPTGTADEETTTVVLTVTSTMTIVPTISVGATVSVSRLPSGQYQSSSSLSSSFPRPTLLESNSGEEGTSSPSRSRVCKRRTREGKAKRGIHSRRHHRRSNWFSRILWL